MTAYSNPVLPGMHPDPSACRVGDTFYLANSSFEYFPGLPLHSSTDLVTWTPIGHAVDRPGQLDLAGVPDSGGLYAPTLRHHDGRFYLACTSVGGERGGSFLLTAIDPAGPWSDPVWVTEATGIDPDLFFDGDTAWWAGCRLVEPGAYPGQTEIWLRELDLTTGALVGDEHILWNGALHGAVWAEGPHLYRHGDWFYLLAAEGGTERHHAVSVARSRRVTGPYEGSPGNPILTHRHLGRTAAVQNVGHADLVDGPDGSWWAVALGVRPRAGGHVLGRETFLAPVAWEDEWPVINPGDGLLDAAGRTPFAAATTAAPDRLQDDFTGPAPARHWLSLRGPAAFAGTGPGGLRLTPTGHDLASLGQAAFLGCRLRHHDASAVITVLVPAPGVTVGLALRQSAAFQVRIELHADDRGALVTATERDGGVEKVLGSVRLDPAAADLTGVRLEAALSERGVDLVATAGGTRHALGRADAGVLSTERAGGFVGTLVGPFATGDPARQAVVTAFDYRPTTA